MIQYKFTDYSIGGGYRQLAGGTSCGGSRHSARGPI